MSYYYAIILQEDNLIEQLIEAGYKPVEKEILILKYYRPLDTFKDKNKNVIYDYEIADPHSKHYNACYTIEKVWTIDTQQIAIGVLKNQFALINHHPNSHRYLDVTTKVRLGQTQLYLVGE